MVGQPYTHFSSPYTNTFPRLSTDQFFFLKAFTAFFPARHQSSPAKQIIAKERLGADLVPRSRQKKNTAMPQETLGHEVFPNLTYLTWSSLTKPWSAFGV